MLKYIKCFRMYCNNYFFGFEYFNKKLEQDFLLIQSKKKLLGIGKAEEGKIKPIRVFNL